MNTTVRRSSFLIHSPKPRCFRSLFLSLLFRLSLLLHGTSGNPILNFNNLFLRTSVCAEPLLGETPCTLLGIVATPFEDLGNTTFVRGVTHSLTDDVANDSDALVCLRAF